MTLTIESGQIRILPVAGIRPAPENATLYRPIDSNDPDLQIVLQEAIESVVDREALNREIAAKKQDAAHLDALRRQVKSLLVGMNTQESGDA